MIKPTADFLRTIGLQAIPQQFSKWGSDIPDGQFIQTDFSSVCGKNPEDETNPCWFCVCATCKPTFRLD